MRKIIALCLLAACGMAQAEGRSHEECKSWANIASMVMEQRQNGRPMVDVVEDLRSLDLGEQMESATTKMTAMAYKEYGCATDQCRERQINEFSSTWYLACTQG